jgi:hypothetical protein
MISECFKLDDVNSIIEVIDLLSLPKTNFKFHILIWPILAEVMETIMEMISECFKIRF